MLKKCKIVMLPTNQKTKYLMVYSDVEKTKGKLILNGLKNDEYKEYQHLYIISDDEIKKGDYIYCTITNAIEIAKYNHDYLIRDWKKVIATTDTSLLIDTYINQGDTVKGNLIIKRGSDYTTELRGKINLPQPSQQFIQKYIEEYNKGNIITDVLVEYNYFLDDNGVLPYWNLKVNPKDNTTTIKKTKENYTKEEVIRLLEKFISFIWSEVGIHYPISLGNDAKDKFINREL